MAPSGHLNACSQARARLRGRASYLHVLGYAIFFLRSAQRFFIAKDIRLRASGVIPPRRRPSLGRPFAFGAPCEESPFLPALRSRERSDLFRLRGPTISSANPQFSPSDSGSLSTYRGIHSVSRRDYSQSPITKKRPQRSEAGCSSPASRLLAWLPGPAISSLPSWLVLPTRSAC